MSEEKTARLKVTEEDGITVVELQDRKILDEINIMQIGEQLFQIVAESDQLKLVLDFWQVVHMSSAALGVLITVHKRVRETSGQLCLCSIQPLPPSRPQWQNAQAKGRLMPLRLCKACLTGAVRQMY